MNRGPQNSQYIPKGSMFTCRHCGATSKKASVVFEGPRWTCKKCGVDRYNPKPLDPALRKAIRKAIRDAFRQGT